MKNLLALLALLPSLLFAAAPGDMQAGNWVQINQTTGTGATLNSVASTPYTGAGSLRQIMDAWGGGAFATTLGSRGSLLVHGGGHNDYLGNETYAFDVATGRWSLLYAHGSSCTLSTSVMNSPANSPCASHTYDTLEFAPVTNEFIKAGSTSDDYTTVGTNRVRAYNVLTNTWRLLGQMSGQNSSPDDDMESSFTAYDSTRNVVWWHGGWRANGSSNLQKINPVTNVVTPYTGIQSIDQYAQMAYDPSRQILVILEGNDDGDDIHVIDVTTGTPVLYAGRTITGSPNLPNACGFDYDPIADKFYVYCGSTTVYQLTPPATWATNKSAAWTWTTLSPGGANPGASADNGTYGRFRYAPALCAFVAVNDTTGGVYAYRSPNGGTNCGGTPTDPPPAVTLTATPASINSGNSSLLEWVTSNTSSCTASGDWSGTKTASGGSQSVAPTASSSYTLTCLGVGTQSATTAVSTAAVNVQTGGGGSSDFDTRKAAAGVVAWEDFDQTGDFVQGSDWQGLWPIGSTFQGTRDTSIKSSGASSLRFHIPSNSGADTSGYWVQKFSKAAANPATGLNSSPNSGGFGPGDTLYFQYRQRMDPTYVNYNWSGLTGGTGIKTWIMTRRGPSCTTLQFVQVRLYGRTFPEMYSSCGTPNLYVSMPDGDLRIQQGDVDCRYRSQGGCKSYQADKWTTFSYKMTLGNFGANTTRIEGWMGEEGTPPVKIYDYPNFALDYESSTSERFDVLHLTPYNTNKNSSVAHPSAYVWYDDLIISSQPIAWPSGGSATPAPTINIAVTPATIPSGSAAQIDWSTTNATSCTGSNGWSGSIPTSGSQSTGNLTASRTYTLSCTGAGGTTEASASVTVQAAAPTVNLSAASPVNSGQGSQLTWSSTGATSCTASGGWSGTKATFGTQLSAALTADTTFGLSCTGPGGTTAATPVVVSVISTPPTITLTATPAGPLSFGGSTLISWSSQYATACGWAQGFTPGSYAPLSGSQSSGQLTQTTTYELACTNASQQTARSIIVSVNAALIPVITGFVAEPSTINAGDTAALLWSSFNTSSCSIDQSVGTVGTTETTGVDVTPPVTTTYTLTCTGAGGSTAQSVTVTVNSLPLPLVGIVADPTEVTSGGSATLYWTSQYADTCTASGGWSGSKATAGNQSTGPLTAPTSFILACENATGTVQASANVGVTAIDPPSIFLDVAPNPAPSGTTIAIAWVITNGTSCTASGDWSGSKAVPSGSENQGPLTENKTYTLACSNAGGSTAETRTVTITTTPNPAPVVNLAVLPGEVASGETAVLNWGTANATSCTASGGWSGSKATSGNETTAPITSATTYTLTCTGAGGTTADSANVVVTTTADPTASISVNPTTITEGTASAVTWACTDSTTATAEDGAGEWGGSLPLSGTRSTGPLTTDTDFTVVCSDGVDDDSATATVTVTAAATMTLTASPARVSWGDSSTLTWTTSGSLDSCFWIDGFDTGRVAAPDDSRSTGALTRDKRFTLNCFDSTTITSTSPLLLSRSVVVNINPGTIPRSRRPRCRLWWCR